MGTISTFPATHGDVLSYRLWQADKKTKNTIVLVHGLSSNYTRWSEFIDHTRLKQGWNILAPDLRGHGDSMTRRHVTLELWADDLSNILKHAGLEQAVIIGHSLGAHIALMFAKRHPKQTRGLVLIDPLSEAGLSTAARMVRKLRWLFLGFIFFIRLLNKLGLHRSKLPGRDLRKLDEEVRQILKAGNVEEFVRRYSSPWPDLKVMPTANYLQYILEVIRTLPEIENFNAPLLLLLSGGSQFNASDNNHSLADLYSHGDTVTIAANHWLLTEKPVESRQAIEAWFEKSFRV